MGTFKIKVKPYEIYPLKDLKMGEYLICRRPIVRSSGITIFHSAGLYKVTYVHPNGHWFYIRSGHSKKYKIKFTQNKWFGRQNESKIQS